ncbi:unnamed protein product [Rhizoctonia solani]|uniref:Uncharacterized protein n=1 Tax=Rhizoctonia solani TaxID=456999 RepID=A0A8H3HXE2_9AGAM|nr:unnamed protein product [Rhizoctonia solani]
MSPITPFTFNVTPISPLFRLSPVASNINDTSLGWTPSCATPDCLPTASWSTSAINSTLSFQYWGGGVALDGRVEGNMSTRFIRDGIEAARSHSGDTLFSWPDNDLDYLYLHDITLKVVDASPDARLTVTRVQVNGSSLSVISESTARWIVPSNKDGLRYIGFTQQASETQTGSSTTYVSSTAGDTMSMEFNGSSLLVYGPCGPDNGLMRVSIDGEQQIVNSSKPFACSDCLLFQARGLQPNHLKRLLIENVDGKTLGINRLELFRVRLPVFAYPGVADRAVAVGCGILSVFLTCMMMMAVYVIKFVKKRRSMGGPYANQHWFQLLSS